MAKTRGRLNKTDQNFIMANVNEMDVAEIAESLNRTEEVVEKYIIDHNLKPVSETWEEERDIKLRGILHRKPYWSEVVNQFTKDELVYFEASWVRLQVQFREDVLYSEEIQILDYLRLEILINRSMKERKSHQEEKDRLQQMVDEEYAKDRDEREPGYLANLETQLTFVRSALTSYTTEHTKLLSEVKYITKSLKANRDERIKRIEDGKSNWMSFLRMLEDGRAREKVGEKMELRAIAKDKARERLGEFHEYDDGVVDQPLLNCSTVLRNNKE